MDSEVMVDLERRIRVSKVFPEIDKRQQSRPDTLSFGEEEEEEFQEWLKKQGSKDLTPQERYVISSMAVILYDGTTRPLDMKHFGTLDGDLYSSLMCELGLVSRNVNGKFSITDEGVKICNEMMRLGYYR